jgi:hypothetical protein
VRRKKRMLEGKQGCCKGKKSAGLKKTVEIISQK